MNSHFLRETERLKRHLFALCALVERNVRQAVKAVELGDEELANNVIELDLEVDESEVDVEEECLKLLALYQPVAADLRYIVAVLKINNDLERIGDLAVNIAERAAFLARQEKTDIPFDFAAMAEKVQSMLKRSIDAMVDADSRLARQVCRDDDEVDDMNREMYDLVKSGIRRRLDWMDSLIHLLSVSRHLERIADHATNIAEDVVYMVEGEVVRHRTEDYLRDT